MREKKKEVVRFKLKYIKEITRNAMLHATQPKPRTWKSLYVTPPAVMKRMLFTLANVFIHVSDSLKEREEIERAVARKSKGKSGAEAHMIRLNEEVKCWTKRVTTLDKKLERRKR